MEWRKVIQKPNTWLWAAWLIALGATLMSLSLQYLFELIPCELCWYQRIFMYPLAFLLGVGIYRKDMAVARYGLPLSIVGALIAAYHYSLQMFGSTITTCSSFVSCTTRYIEYFGFITIPFGSLLSFVAISLSLYMVIRLSGRNA